MATWPEEGKVSRCLVNHDKSHARFNAAATTSYRWALPISR
jgi:hypothetical protein